MSYYYRISLVVACVTKILNNFITAKIYFLILMCLEKYFNIFFDFAFKIITTSFIVLKMEITQYFNGWLIMNWFQIQHVKETCIISLLSPCLMQVNKIVVMHAGGELRYFDILGQKMQILLNNSFQQNF